MTLRIIEVRRNGDDSMAADWELSIYPRQEDNWRINSLDLLVQVLLGSLPHFDEDHRREFLSRLKTMLTFGNGG
jgi:hypothetical protein